MMDNFLDKMRALSYIPPGFGFNPTEQELLCYNLRRKVNGEDMDDYCIIPEVDVFNHKPCELRERYMVPTNESKWYFFTSSSNLNRDTNFDYWQATNSKYEIRHGGKVIGRKLPLVFFEGQRPGQKTEWAMEQYYLLEDKHSDTSQIKDRFVLCRITKKETEHLISDMPAPQQMDIFLNAMRALSPIPPGFGFNPTDQQLLGYYLRRKVNGEDMDDYCIIPEVDVFDHKPCELRDRYNVPTTELKWHFFRPGSNRKKAKEWGLWKTPTKNYPIMHAGKTLGTKKRLSFYEGQRGNRKKTTWVMYEYNVDKDQCKVAQMKDRFALCLVVREMEEADTSAPQEVDGSFDPASIVGCIPAAPEPRPYALSERPEDGIPSLIQEENQNRSTQEERSSFETANFAVWTSLRLARWPNL